MKDVPTKVKSAFTRAFNATSHAVRCSLQLEDPKKGRCVWMSKAALLGACRVRKEGGRRQAEQEEESCTRTKATWRAGTGCGWASTRCGSRNRASFLPLGRAG
eukprot:364899-Chlamydomonas_euryale.AAC.2